MMKMPKIFLLTILFFFGVNHFKSQINNSEQQVYEVSDIDKDMNAAILKAQKTFNQFEKAIKSNATNYKNFTLKKAFPSDFGDEHIWIMYILPHSTKKDVYVGIVGNEPLNTKKVKLDEVVEVSKKEVTDWMFYENDQLKGAYTMKVLRNRMTEADKKNFDEETGNIFKD